MTGLRARHRLRHALAFRTLCCAWAGGAHGECRLGAVAVLPLHVERGEMVFAAEVNDRPTNFILDTGAFATTLKKSAADRLGMRVSQIDGDIHGVGGVRHTWRGTARHMRIGQMSADGMELVATDMLEKPADADLDGLFGMNMMAAYDLDLGIAGGHAVIYEADGDCRKPTVALAQPLYMVPLAYITNDRQADVDITIDGRPIRAVVDSGAAQTVIFRRTASRLGVNMGAMRAPGHRSGYGIGPQAVAEMEHVFSSVKIGNLEIHNMPIAILDQSNMGVDRVHVGSLLADPSSGEAGGEDMLLGADFMQKVHLWISHSSHTLIMQYPPRASVLPR